MGEDTGPGPNRKVNQLLLGLEEVSLKFSLGEDLFKLAQLEKKISIGR